MAIFDRSQAPYYDDYEASKKGTLDREAHNYTHLLAIPGRVAQAREITQIQSVTKDIIKSLGDSLFKDGNVIEGCQVITGIDDTDHDHPQPIATVTEGKVYLNGIVLKVDETTIPIVGEGTEAIGFKLVETLITEREDRSLRDPAQNYDNYNQPGCHRIDSKVVIVRVNPEDPNDPNIDAVTLVKLIDGSVAVEKYAPDYDVMTQTLARRTYDESGSYIVDGLTVRVEESENECNYTVVVESGKAYVLGYELRIPAPRRLEVPRSLETTTIRDRSFEYDDATKLNQLSETPYVKQIQSISGKVLRTISISFSPNTDMEIGTNVTSVSSVMQNTTEFTQNTDYKVVTDGYNRCFIRWIGDSQPSSGAALSVEYTEIKKFVEGTDYELYHDVSDDSYYIRWIESEAAQHPKDKSDYSVTYDVYLARKDIVYIDQYGDINVALGTPANYGYETLPESPFNTLVLANIMSPPNGSVSDNQNLNILVSNIGLTRFTMRDIQRLIERVETMEYDQAVLSLNDAAKQYYTENDKRGIFTDPLIDLDKIDLYYNLRDDSPLDTDLPIYDATMDLDSNICYLPNVTNVYDAEVVDAASATGYYKQYTRLATLALADTKHSEVLSQMTATKGFRINPYSRAPRAPEITLTPSVDTWYNDKVITVPVSKKTTQVVSTSTRKVYTTKVESGSFKSYDTKSSSTKDTSIGTKVTKSSTESVVSCTPTTYIREREIKISGTNFPVRLDNIVCYFDGKKVALTPTGTTTTAGTVSGSVKSNSSGNFTAKFTIPPKVLTGIREVRVESTANLDVSTIATALYQAKGYDRTIQKTVTTLTTVLVNRVTTVTTTHHVDPLGQTFVLDHTALISGVYLYFHTKPDPLTVTAYPVTCEIREVVNGSITSTVYGQKTLIEDAISVDPNKAAIPTYFEFDGPVLIEEDKEYAIVVKTESNNYYLWTAEIGEKDVSTGSTVVYNPYLLGTMMSSSNNSSWTVHQTSDIKFKLVEENYKNSSTIEFKNIHVDDGFCRIYLNAEAFIPEGTSVDWYYSVDEGVNYTAITPYNLTILDKTYNDLKIKAELSKSPDSRLSPIVALDSVVPVVSRYDTEGTYITKEITGLDPYTHVDVILDTYIPSSSTRIDVYVSTGNDKQRTKATLDANETRTLNYGWSERTYRVDVTEANKCRIFVEMESDFDYTTPAFSRLRAIMS